MTIASNIGQALQRVSLKDMLVVPETTDLFLTNLTQHANQDPAQVAALEASCRDQLEMAYGYGETRDEDRKPFVYSDGVAVIPIHGTLINRFNSSWGFVTGYNYIRRMMNAALDDDDVELIVFDVDSPGGEASGCFELAREIMASRRVKPSLAVIDSLAASGGMALAGAATTVYAIPSARIGSIGVYRMHVSYEAALKNDGIKVTFATAGEHKIDGNPYQDLPQAVLDEWTDSAGKTWDDFIALVAEGRDISEAEVRDTQARVYRADEALAKGLINAVKTPTEAVAAFLAELADDSPSNDDEDDMADAPKTKEVTSALTPADMASIGSMIATSIAAAIAPLASAGRAQAIKDLGAAQGKAKLAATLAADESITLEQAKVILGAAAPEGKQKTKVAVVADPSDDEGDDDSDDGEDEDDGDDDGDDGEEAADAARRARLNKGKGKQKAKSGRRGDSVNHLDNAMGKSRQPNVGSGDEGASHNDDDETDDQISARILGDHNRVAGADWSGMKKVKKSRS